MAPFFHYWWVIPTGAVGLPIVSGAFWKQTSLAYARLVYMHSRDPAKRQRAKTVLDIEGSGTAIPGTVLAPLPPALSPVPCASCPSTFGTRVCILGLMSLPTSPSPPSDARHASPGVGWKEWRYGPRHVAVWVRIGGEWRRGRVVEWVRQIDRDGWDVVILADETSPGPPWQGRYVFDPRSIRPRHTDQPPGDAASLT